MTTKQLRKLENEARDSVIAQAKEDQAKSDRLHEAPNPIKKYVVRVPGNTSWSEHATERAARREAEKANRICRPGHRVFACHANGDVTALI